MLLTFAPVQYKDEGTYCCVITINDVKQEVNVSSDGIVLTCTGNDIT